LGFGEYRNFEESTVDKFEKSVKVGSVGSISSACAAISI